MSTPKIKELLFIRTIGTNLSLALLSCVICGCARPIPKTYIPGDLDRELIAEYACITGSIYTGYSRWNAFWESDGCLYDTRLFKIDNKLLLGASIHVYLEPGEHTFYYRNCSTTVERTPVSYFSGRSGESPMTEAAARSLGYSIQYDTKHGRRITIQTKKSIVEKGKTYTWEEISELLLGKGDT